MNDWKAVVNNALTHLLQNPQTTISSILTVAISVGVYCSLTPTHMISQETAADITWVVGGLKIVLGFIQKDSK